MLPPGSLCQLIVLTPAEQIGEHWLHSERKHRRRGLRDSASAFSCDNPLWCSIGKSYVSSTESHLAMIPSGSLKFLSQIKEE